MGGAERQAVLLGQYLKDEIGAKVSFLAWTGGKAIETILKKADIPFSVFPLREIVPKTRRIIDLIGLTLLIRKEIQPDFILPFIGFNSKIIGIIWKFTGAKYAWWNQQDEGRGLFRSKNERRALLNVCNIVSNSYEGQRFLSEAYDIPINKIKVYNNGTLIPDRIIFEPFWRKKIGGDSDAKVVSMIANITRFKDHKTLFYAWETVQNHFRKKNEKVVLLLAGRFKENVKELKVLGFDLNVSDSVKFLGAIDRTDELIIESELIVHSSNKEGCPNSVCEAMAQGKAVVGTNISGVRQALGEKHQEYCLSEPNNPKDLSAKIIYLLENPELMAKIGKSNLERIKTEFSMEKMVEFFLTLIWNYTSTKR